MSKLTICENFALGFYLKGHCPDDCAFDEIVEALQQDDGSGDLDFQILPTYQHLPIKQLVSNITDLRNYAINTFGDS